MLADQLIPAQPARPAANQLPVSNAISETTTYGATASAARNSSASTVNYDLSTPWTLNGAQTVASLSVGNVGPLLSWNGTVAMIHLEWYGGTDNFDTNDIGCIYANLTVTGTPYGYSWNQCPNAYLAGQTTHDVNWISPTWSFPGAAPFSHGVRLALTEVAATTAGLYFNQAPYPNSLVSWSGPGAANAYLQPSTSAHSSTAVPLMYGWMWSGAPTTTSSFNWGGSATASGYLTWTAPDAVSATYNSVTETAVTSGLFHGSLSVSTVAFVGGTFDPFNVFSVPVSYVVHMNVSAQYLVTYNYTLSSSPTKNTGLYGATTVVEYNATASLYTYTIPTPFPTTTVYIQVGGNTSWTFVSAAPTLDQTYTSANQTAAWSCSAGSCPYTVQVIFLAPTVYDSTTLTVVYVPTSPVFSVFGAALPYNSVLTYINGVFAPYQTSPATIGSSYNITTYDVFGHLDSQVNVMVTQPSQVASITLPIWPMTIVNLNGSDVVAINVEHFHVTQQAPDLMPLQTQTLYLTQGLYNFTLQYLGFGGGTVSPPTTFPLNISGVSYSVVTGNSFLNIENIVVSIGNNLTKIITGVNITLLQTNANLESLVNALSEGLFAYHLQPGMAIRTGNTFSVPIVVTTGTGLPANYTATQAIQRALVLTYLNGTGSYATSFFVNGSAPGQFWLTITLSPSQVADIEGGTAIAILTAVVNIGNPPGAAAGAIGAAVLESAVYSNQTVNPNSQMITLDLTNTTRNSGSGYYTSTGTWTNHQGTTFAGSIVLTGPWVSTASDVSIQVNGTALVNGTFVLETGQLLVLAGTVTVPVGATITVSVTYEAIAAISVDSALFQFGGLVVTTPVLIFLVALVATAVVAVDDFAVRRTRAADNSLAVLLAFLVFGAMFCF